MRRLIDTAGEHAPAAVALFLGGITLILWMWIVIRVVT